MMSRQGGKQRASQRVVRGGPGRPGRRGLVNRDALAISRRLRAWYTQRYENQGAFADKIRVPESTVSGWLKRKQPKAIDPRNLLQLARSEGLSLDWLLLGEGPELRDTDRPLGELTDALRAYVIATLSTGELAEFAGVIKARVPRGEDLLMTLLRAEREKIQAIIREREALLESDSARVRRGILEKQLGDLGEILDSPRPDQMSALHELHRETERKLSRQRIGTNFKRASLATGMLDHMEAIVREHEDRTEEQPEALDPTA